VRPSQFTVNLQFPTLVETAGISNRVQFLCRSADLPESSMGVVEVPYFGRTIKVNGDREFRDWQVRIMMDDYQIRHGFLAWHNAINTIISNRMDERVVNINPAIGNSYKTIATVTSFDKVGPGDIDGDGALATYRFDGIFPREIGPVRMDWDAKNQIAEFDVTFSYDWYEPLTRANDIPIFPTELNPV
jgi:hypothetical protein